MPDFSGFLALSDNWQLYADRPINEILCGYRRCNPIEDDWSLNVYHTLIKVGE